MGVEDIGVITSVGEQNSILERRKEMIEHGFVSEKLNVGVIKEKLDEIRSLVEDYSRWNTLSDSGFLR